MTDQHYVRCPSCTLEGVSLWAGVGAGSCAVCQGVGFVPVDGVLVERSRWDRIVGRAASSCAPYGWCTTCDQCSPDCTCPDRDAEDRWLVGDAVEIGELAPRIALKDQPDATGELLREARDKGVNAQVGWLRTGWTFSAVVAWIDEQEFPRKVRVNDLDSPLVALKQALAAVSGDAANDTKASG